LGSGHEEVWIHLVGEARDGIYSDATLCAPPACLRDLCGKLRFLGSFDHGLLGWARMDFLQELAEIAESDFLTTNGRERRK
jgi:hypothetical protein